MVTVIDTTHTTPKTSQSRAIPHFGSPEVAAYGALGLSAAIEDPVAKGTSASTHQEPSDGKPDVFELERTEPLRLVEQLKHHDVDGDHLWIEVEDGKLIVADDLEHELFLALQAGASPYQVSEDLAQCNFLTSIEAWAITLSFIGRLAAAGMIVGVRGYHAVKAIQPHSFARFHMTNRCQLECIHCYTNSGPHVSADGELSVERWIELVDAFADNGGKKLLFTGGEALVYRGCVDVMRRAKERNLEVTLFSNGILIKRYLADLKGVVDVVQISLDGPDEASHDAVRGRGSFKKAIAAIEMLLAAGIETRVSTTIMLNNWAAIRDHFPLLIERFENTDLTFRVSYGTMSHGRGEQLEHSLNDQEVRDYVDGLLTRVKTSENRETGVNVVQKIIGCGYAEQIVVAPNGVIYPCHLMSGALGHIDQLPLPQITDYLKETVEAFSVRNRKGCGTCDLRNLCGGSCRVEDEKTTSSRLITTCTVDNKIRKRRFLVRRYKPAPAASQA